jgi:hypothetical protein
VRIYPGGSSDGTNRIVSECRYCHAVEVVCSGCGRVFVFRGGHVGFRVHVCKRAVVEATG